MYTNRNRNLLWSVLIARSNGRSSLGTLPTATRSYILLLSQVRIVFGKDGMKQSGSDVSWSDGITCSYAPPNLIGFVKTTKRYGGVT